jgi:hypothetical protein
MDIYSIRTFIWLRRDHLLQWLFLQCMIC